MRIALLTASLMTVGFGAAPEPGGIQRLSWLQGCWKMTSAERTVEEIWSAPRGRSMLGMSRTLQRAELATYELVVVRERGERLVYIAHGGSISPIIVRPAQAIEPGASGTTHHGREVAAGAGMRRSSARSRAGTHGAGSLLGRRGCAVLPQGP